MENKEERYLYSINPRCKIKSSIPELNNLTRAKNLYLTKEEVLSTLKYATIYRRFSVNNSVHVTSLNIDKLHIPFPDAIIDKKEEEIVKEEIVNNKPVVEEIEENIISEDETVVEAIVEEEPIIEEENIENSDLNENIEIDNYSISEDLYEEPQDKIDVTTDTMERGVVTNVVVENKKKENKQQNYNKNKKHH